MKKYLTITLRFCEDLGLEAVGFDFNTTGLPDNNDTLAKVTRCLTETIAANKDECDIQDAIFDALDSES